MPTALSGGRRFSAALTAASCFGRFLPICLVLMLYWCDIILRHPTVAYSLAQRKSQA